MLKKTIALMLAVLMAMLCLGVAAIAEDEDLEPSMPDLDFWEGNRVVALRVMNLPDDATIVSVKSGKPTVLKAILDEGTIRLQPLKKGKSKITVKYKSDGKTSSLSETYTVNKYPKPLSALVINGKSVNFSRYKYFYELNSYDKVKTTVTFTPNRGWTVTGSYVDISDPASPAKRMKVTSGKRFNIADGKDASVYLTLENTNGQTLTYIISFVR